MNRAERRRAERSAEIPPEIKQRIRAAKAANPEVKHRARAAANGDTPPTDEMPFSIDELPADMQQELNAQLADLQAGAAKSSVKGGKRPPKYLVLESQINGLSTRMPAKIFKEMGDTFCEEHFLTEGPLFASELTQLCEQKASVYRAVSKLVDQLLILTLGVRAGRLVGVPLAHHRIMPDPLRPLFGVRRDADVDWGDDEETLDAEPVVGAA